MSKVLVLVMVDMVGVSSVKRSRGESYEDVVASEVYTGVKPENDRVVQIFIRSHKYHTICILSAKPLCKIGKIRIVGEVEYDDLS